MRVYARAGLAEGAEGVPLDLVAPELRLDGPSLRYDTYLRYDTPGADHWSITTHMHVLLEATLGGEVWQRGGSRTPPRAAHTRAACSQCAPNVLPMCVCAAECRLLRACLRSSQLFSVLRAAPNGAFPERRCQFYAAMVVLAFEYLHGKQIVYRDLKPENLLLEASGYLRLVDFGFAKRLDAGGRTWTVCGTPEYFATTGLSAYAVPRHRSPSAPPPLSIGTCRPRCASTRATDWPSTGGCPPPRRDGQLNCHCIAMGADHHR